MKKALFIVVLCVGMLGGVSSTVYSAAVPTPKPVVTGFNEFAFDLYHQVGKAEENVLISPYSLSSLLGLLVNAAADNTRAQLLDVLHLTTLSTTETLTSELAQLDQSMNSQPACKAWLHCQLSRVKRWLGLASSSQTFTVANALWADKSLNYEPSFLANVGQNQSLHFYRLNFMTAPETARLQINAWVSHQTHDYIRDLIAKGQIDTQTRLVLTNALYFKGQWQAPFKQEETRQQAFTLTSGQQTPVAMMQREDQFLYTEDDDLQLLQLPYANSTLAMVILLPKPKQTLQAIQQLMNADRFLRLVQTVHEQEVQLSLPKFTIAATFNNLNHAMQNLGLTDAFNEKANFSNMTKHALSISAMIQKAMIQVDEAGTVAAAATTTLMRATAYIPPVIFAANHPFLFVIYDTQSKLILFMGQVVHPQGASQ